MKLIFAFLLFSFSAGALPADEIQSIIQALPPTSLNDRIEAASFSFLGRPYMLGPLGEGALGKYDQDPLYRSDAFDCTTFVETVIAMAQTQNLKDFKNLLASIRYENGEVDFVKRNHFVEIDWNINNQKLGLLGEITDQLAQKSDLFKLEQTFDKRAWYRSKSVNDLHIKSPMTAQELESRAQELRNEGLKFSAQKNSLTLIHPSQIKNVLTQIQEPAVINVIRSYDVAPAGMPNSFVVHQVLLVHRNGNPRIRQASSRKDVMRVTDSSIDEFMESPIMELPKLMGINIQKIIDLRASLPQTANLAH